MRAARGRAVTARAGEGKSRARRGFALLAGQVEAGTKAGCGPAARRLSVLSPQGEFAPYVALHL